MRGTGKNRLVAIAGACLFASTILVFELGSLHSALRFFLAGLLFGTAILLITLSRWTGFK
jgi:hypothetical protein